MAHPATRHVKRLQDENRELRNALALERAYRREITVKFTRKLNSKFIWLIMMYVQNTKKAWLGQ